MRYSILIATYNRCELIARTLPRVLSQDFPGDEYEVLVVVDGSVDGTVEMLRRLNPKCAFRILEQPNRGQAVALNAGLQVARGRWVLFLDDDILCDRTLLAEHFAAQQEIPPTVVVGPVRVASESPKTVATEWLRSWSSDDSTRLTPAGQPRWPHVSVGRANSSAPLSALIACGGFDEALVGSRDDVDLGLRLWKAGLRFRYQPTAMVHQIYVKSVRDLVHLDAVRCGRNEVLLCRKNPSYRPHSPLARLGAGSGPKRLAREIGVRCPGGLDPLLAIPLAVAGRLPQGPRLRKWSIRLLQARMGVAMYRSASRATGSWRNLKQEFGIRLPVLLYHRIAPDRNALRPELSVSPEVFSQHLSWLVRHGYKGIRPSDWLAACNGAPLPPRPVLITFDDAYAETAQYGLPAIVSHGFSAAVFVITRQIGRTTDWDGRPMMTANQIKEWAARGIEIGAHSRTHPDLTRVDAARLKDEIVGSRNDLEDLLAAKIGSFAYPYGCYNEVVRGCVESAFDLAYTCEEGINNFGSDPASLSRIEIRPGQSSVTFGLRMSLGYSPIERLRRRAALRARIRRVVFGLPSPSPPSQT